MVIPPLSRTVLNANLEGVKILLEKGANKELKVNGKIALELAKEIKAEYKANVDEIFFPRK